MHEKSSDTDSLESQNYCITSYFNVSVSKPSTTYRTIRNMANIDHPSFIAELSKVSEFSSVEHLYQLCDFLCVEKVNQFYDVLCIVLDKHAPPSL